MPTHGPLEEDRKQPLQLLLGCIRIEVLMPGELRDLKGLKLLGGIVVDFEFAAYWIRKRKGSANCREVKRSLRGDLEIRTTCLLGQFQKLVEAELVPDHDALFRPFPGR